MGKPRNTRKYLTNLEIPEISGNTRERKKDTRTYPIVYLDTPTRPERDPLPGILSNTRPDPILKNPTRWALFVDELFSLIKYFSPFPLSVLPFCNEGQSISLVSSVKGVGGYSCHIL